MEIKTELWSVEEHAWKMTKRQLTVRTGSQHNRWMNKNRFSINCRGFLAKHSVNTGLPLADRWTVSGTSQLVLVFLPSKKQKEMPNLNQVQPSVTPTHRQQPAASTLLSGSLPGSVAMEKKWVSRRGQNSIRVGALMAIRTSVFVTESHN